MKDFIPEAEFDVNDEPVGDKRWFYQQLYQRSNWPYNGQAPDQYSPHTGTEEREIQEAIITGELKCRNRYEKGHRNQIDLPRPRSEWPRKWITCKRCQCEWNEIGYPIGRKSLHLDRYLREVNAYLLMDSTTKIVWIYPKYCSDCVDYLTAQPVKSKKDDPKPQQSNLPYKDS